MENLLKKSVYLVALLLGFTSCKKDTIEQKDLYESTLTMSEIPIRKNLGISETLFLEVLHGENSTTAKKIPDENFIKNFQLNKAYYFKDEHQEVLSVPVKSWGAYKISFLSINQKHGSNQYVFIYPDSTNHKRFYVANLKGELIKRVSIDEFGVGHDDYLGNSKTKRDEVCTESVYVCCSSGNHSFDKGNAMECTFWNDLSKGTPPQVFKVNVDCDQMEGSGSSTGGIGGSFPSQGENDGGGRSISIPPTESGGHSFNDFQCAQGVNCPGQVNQVLFYEFIATLSNEDNVFINRNLNIQNHLYNLSLVNGINADFITFTKKLINLKKTNSLVTNEILFALFNRKHTSPEASFEQCFTLAVIDEMTSPLTNSPVELYLILKHKNPNYFDISSFSKGGENILVGDYTLTPHYSSNKELVFYTASRQQGNGLKNGIEYVIKPDALANFKEQIDLYTAAANLFYLNGIPSDGQIAVAAGDYVSGLGSMWYDAIRSAEWWMYMITTMGHATINPYISTTVRTQNKQLLNNYFTKWSDARKSFSSETIKKINVQWAKVGYTVRESWNGAKNIFKATDEEIADATKRIKDYRTKNNLKGGNYGYLEGAVNGKKVDNKMWRSVPLPDAKKEIHIFEAIEATSTKGNTWLRITDSEYRMLNKLAKDLGAVKGGKYPRIKGEIKIISEFKYCDSCTGIIEQFNEMFPNVKLILVDGVK